VETVCTPVHIAPFQTLLFKSTCASHKVWIIRYRDSYLPYKDYCLLGCDTMHRKLLFQWNLQPPSSDISSTLMMETAGSSEMFVILHQTTWCHIPISCCENLDSHTISCWNSQNHLLTSYPYQTTNLEHDEF
jgi:hypothetical protein